MAMGLEIAAVSAHKPTDTEFTAAVLRLKNAGCDLVMVGLVHRDTILVLETARKMGWEDVAWVGNEAAYSQVIAEQKSGAGEGYYAFVPIALVYEDDESLAPEVRAWLARYRERFGEAPDLPPMLGYRAADLALRGLEIAGPRLDAGEDDRGVGIALQLRRSVRQHAELRPERPQGRRSLDALASARRTLG